MRSLRTSTILPTIQVTLQRTVYGLFFLFSTLLVSAQRAETFIADCTQTGADLKVDAMIRSGDINTWYNWQYSDISGTWRCFVNGSNLINGASFMVSGAFRNGNSPVNDAPQLVIANATMDLNNVLVRLIMRNGASPCNAPAGTTYGGDDLAKHETKYLRLWVNGSSTLCPPNSFLCNGNIAANGDGYFGGFENKFYDAGTENYTDKNFHLLSASTDLQAGSANGQYQVINNPSAVDAGFSRNIAPHDGNFQLVGRSGAVNPAQQKIWYKSVSVSPGNTYNFAVWASRVNSTQPIITLRVNDIVIGSVDLSTLPVGTWTKVQGIYYAPGGTSIVTISISENSGITGTAYSLDDICFRTCSTCSPLPVHLFALTANLKGNDVRLDWIAENELNSQKFVIERSHDGMSFGMIGTLPVSGPPNTPTAYQFIDNISGLKKEILYYRVKVEDHNARFAFTNVVAVRLDDRGEIQVWPVPFSDGINISYQSEMNTRITIMIIDPAGRINWSAEQNVSKGLNQVAIKGLEKLGGGMYLLQITNQATQRIFTQKLVK